MMHSSTRITLQGIHYAFGSHKVLNHIDLTIEPGTIIALLGGTLRIGAGVAIFSALLGLPPGVCRGLFSLPLTAFLATLSGGISPTNLTLHHFIQLFALQGEALQALATSIGLALSAALITGLLGLAWWWVSG